MTEQEAAKAFARQLFGTQQPEPEQSEGDSIEAEAGAGPSEGESEPSAERNQEHDAARAHSEFLTELFRHGNAAKAKADAEFLAAMHPPAKEDTSGGE